MFMYSLKDTTITLGAARMGVQCLGFQGPWKAVRSLPCLNFPRETLTVINHFETKHKKESFMKAVSGNNSNTFFFFDHVIPTAKP